MEQKTQGTNVANEQPSATVIPAVTEGKKSNSAKQGKSQIITVGLKHGEGVPVPKGLETFTFDLSAFTKSVSTLCALISWQVQFTLMGMNLTLRPLRRGNDNSFRAYDLFKQIATGIFGNHELEAVVKFDETSKEGYILRSFYKAGFKFSSCCKKSVINQIETKEKLKREAWKNIVQRDAEKMRKEIALIDAFKADTARLKKLNGEAIGKFTLKFAADLTERNGLQIAEYSEKSE